MLHASRRRGRRKIPVAKLLLLGHSGPVCSALMGLGKGLGATRDHREGSHAFVFSSTGRGELQNCTFYTANSKGKERENPNLSAARHPGPRAPWCSKSSWTSQQGAGGVTCAPADALLATSFLTSTSHPNILQGQGKPRPCLNTPTHGAAHPPAPSVVSRRSAVPTRGCARIFFPACPACCLLDRQILLKSGCNSALGVVSYRYHGCCAGNGRLHRGHPLPAPHLGADLQAEASGQQQTYVLHRVLPVPFPRPRAPGTRFGPCPSRSGQIPLEKWVVQQQQWARRQPRAGTALSTPVPVSSWLGHCCSPLHCKITWGGGRQSPKSLILGC